MAGAEDVRNFNMEQKVKQIADKWRGIPLKGAAQQELIQDFTNLGITDSKRKLITTFRGCCAAFNSYNIEVKTKKATKKDLEVWPQFLKTQKEEYKYIP